MLWVVIRIALPCSLESPRQGDSNEYTQHMFLWRNKQNYPLITTKYPLPAKTPNPSANKNMGQGERTQDPNLNLTSLQDEMSY